MRWVLFQGAPMYLEAKTISRIIELKGKITEMKTDHIPPYKPKAPSFGIETVNAAVKQKEQMVKGKKTMVDVVDWTKVRVG